MVVIPRRAPSFLQLAILVNAHTLSKCLIPGCLVIYNIASGQSHNSHQGHYTIMLTAWCQLRGWWCRCCSQRGDRWPWLCPSGSSERQSGAPVLVECQHPGTPPGGCVKGRTNDEICTNTCSWLSSWVEGDTITYLCPDLPTWSKHHVKLSRPFLKHSKWDQHHHFEVLHTFS